MITQSQAVEYILSHGHAVTVGQERIVAECQLTKDGKLCEYVEYETFMAPYSAKAIRDWLGY